MAISAISNEFGAQIIRKVLADPYRLVRELPRFVFEDAERLIRKINLELTDVYRMASAAEHILFDRAKRYGHTSAPLNRVSRKVSRLMPEFSEPQIEACIIEASDKFDVRDIGTRQHVATRRCCAHELVALRRVLRIREVVQVVPTARVCGARVTGAARPGARKSLLRAREPLCIARIPQAESIAAGKPNPIVPSPPEVSHLLGFSNL